MMYLKYIGFNIFKGVSGYCVVGLALADQHGVADTSDFMTKNCMLTDKISNIVIFIRRYHVNYFGESCELFWEVM